MNHWLQTLSMMTAFGRDFEGGELKQIVGAHVVIEQDGNWLSEIGNTKCVQLGPVIRSIERG